MLSSNFYNCNVLFVLLLLAKYGVSQTREGDTCIEKHTNTYGRCAPARTCQSAISDYQQNGVRPTFCSYNYERALVCCRDGSNILQTAPDPSPDAETESRPVWGSTDNRPSSNSNPNRERVSVRKCQQYSRAVTQKVEYFPLLPDPETMSVTGSKCTFNGVELIVGGQNAELGEFPHMVFDAVRKSNPNFESRIFPVEGDITQLRLGLSDDDWETITGDVNFIFHAAATVRFNEHLKTAIITNVRGTREVVCLAKESLKLRSMVYISTAYSHCYMTSVKEKHYPSPVPPSTIIEFVENVAENRIQDITKDLIKGWPNTYSFSKAIAEEVVRTMGKGLPICVVRPAIVTPSYLEPSPGWLEKGNLYGPSGLVFGKCLGVMRTFLMNRSVEADLVPVDIVNNGIIAASWETAVTPGVDRVYTVSRYRKRYSFGMMQKLWFQGINRFQSPKSVMYSNSSPISTSNHYLFLLLTTLLQFIPALMVDGAFLLMRKKIRITKYYIKGYKINTAVGYFSLKTWDFHDDKTLALFKTLNETDRKIFNFDMDSVDDITFTLVWWLGIRKYIIKDGLKGTEYAVKKQKVLRILYYVLMTLYLLLFYYVCSSLYNLVVFSIFMGLLYVVTQKVDL